MDVNCEVVVSVVHFRHLPWIPSLQFHVVTVETSIRVIGYLWQLRVSSHFGVISRRAPARSLSKVLHGIWNEVVEEVRLHLVGEAVVEDGVVEGRVGVLLVVLAECKMAEDCHD